MTLKNVNEAHTVMFEENGFAINIKVGVFGGYYIEHDTCPDTDPDHRSVAFDTNEFGSILQESKCCRCNKEYSKEMGGFISMLNWEK